MGEAINGAVPALGLMDRLKKAARLATVRKLPGGQAVPPPQGEDVGPERWLATIAG